MDFNNTLFNNSFLDKRNKIKVDNSTDIVALRIISVGVIISCYVYGKYSIKSAYKFILHRNLNFIFPLIAGSFAFANNINDIIHYIYHPEDCCIFFIIFKTSSTLNWPPVSWLKTYRLSLISKIYLKKRNFYFITIVSSIFSTLYCLCYFLNLGQYKYTQIEFTGCGVTNDSKYIYHVMAFDIIDSLFSLGAICIIIYNAIINLRELNTKNEKLNNLVSEGILELIIITIAKIVIYPLISITSYLPAFDVFWDILSVISIYCSYRMVNFPYMGNCKEKNFGRKAFSFIGSKIKNLKTFISTNDCTSNISTNFNNNLNECSNPSIIIDDKGENPSLKGINI